MSWLPQTLRDSKLGYDRAISISDASVKLLLCSKFRLVIFGYERNILELCYPRVCNFEAS